MEKRGTSNHLNHGQQRCINSDKLPTSSDHSEITPQSIKLRDFVLVEYMGAKKTSGRYAYVAQVQEEHVDDGVVEFCVTHLHKYEI